MNARIASAKFEFGKNIEENPRTGLGRRRKKIEEFESPFRNTRSWWMWYEKENTPTGRPRQEEPKLTDKSVDGTENRSEIMESFLNDRPFSAKIEDYFSSNRRVLAGVPQGFCLSHRVVLRRGGTVGSFSGR